MSDLYNTFFTSTGGALILTGLGWFLKDLYLNRKKSIAEAKKKDFLNGMRSIAKVYNAMDSLKECDEIERVLLVEVSNGGDNPRPGSHMYASAVNVKHEDEAEGRLVLEKYNHVKIDDDYILMCIKATETQKAVKIYVGEKDDSPSLLKSFYISEGIKYSEVYHIHTDGQDKKTFVMSISTNKENEYFDRKGLRAIISAEVNLIRSEFESFRLNK